MSIRSDRTQSFRGQPKTFLPLQKILVFGLSLWWHTKAYLTVLSIAILTLLSILLLFIHDRWTIRLQWSQAEPRLLTNSGGRRLISKQ